MIVADYLKPLITQQTLDNMDDTALGGSAAHSHLDACLPGFIHQAHHARPGLCVRPCKNPEQDVKESVLVFGH